ncbi:hypothetical protein acdb102_21050 [Acidothermaceae bacterium B102]|nr:hypothetical protein acdb102_21050 [Acidothermaceae bacterium B102]
MRRDRCFTDLSRRTRRFITGDNNERISTPVIGQTAVPATLSRARAALPFAFAATLAMLVLSGGTWALAATPAPAPTASPSGDNGLATFGIKPSHATLKAPLDTRSRLEYAATPGAVQPDYIAISNDTYKPLTLSVYASDGFNTSSDGFDLLPAGKKPVDVGSWITLKSNVVTVKARGTAVVPIIVRVPLKVTPGDHVGGIVASLRTTEVDKKGDRVAVDHRVGVRVYLRIQGALDPRLTVTNLKAKYHQNWWNPFGSGKVTVSYTVHNVGNVRLGASQSVTVSGWYGGTVQSPQISDVTELLPDNLHGERVVVTSVVPAFHNKAAVTVIPFALSTDVDGQLTTVVANVHFWAIPWAFLCLLAILTLISGYLLRRKLRKSPLPVAVAAADKAPKTVGVKP